MEEPKKIRVKDGKRIAMENKYSPPSLKGIKWNLITGLENDLEFFKKNLKLIDISSVPPQLLELIDFLQDSVEKHTYAYQIVDRTITDVGVKGYEKEHALAIEIVKDYQIKKGDPSEFPKGPYLYDCLNRMAQERKNKKESMLRDVNLRTCQLWLKKMKEGKFNTNVLKDIFDDS